MDGWITHFFADQIALHINGLPQNSVRDIVQTRDGYPWLTTFDGLVRFDGVRFTVFNKSNSPGILTNRFVYLYEDAQGNLWASTENNGLTRLHKGRFTTYTTENGLPDNYVGSLGGDGHGNLLLFIGSLPFGWLGGQFQPADDLRLPIGDVLSDQTQHLASASDGLVKTVCFVDGQLREWDAAKLPQRPNGSSPMRDGQGNTWFGTTEGLMKTRDGQGVQTYTPRNGLPGRQPRLVYGRLPLQALSFSDSGALWLTDLASMQHHLMAEHPPQGLGLHVSYADKEGNIWFGTLYNGLFRARKQSVTAYAKAHGLSNTEVYPIFEDRAGTIWVGGYGGLYRFQDGAFTNIRFDTSREVIAVPSLYQDRAGRLWIGGTWRLEDGRFVHAISKDVWPNLVLGALTMYEDPEGAFWFGTDQGVGRYQNGAATRYTTKDGLAGDDTKVIIEDGAGGLWIGSYGGLTHYQNGRFTAWSERDGPPGATVRALYQDGFEIARAIRDARLKVAVIFLTMHKDEHFLNQALDLGVKGYIVKDSALTETVQCIRTVAAGQEYVSPQLTSFLLNRSRRVAQLAASKPQLTALSPVERRVLRLVAEYKSNRQIADQLCLSVRTIEHHRARISQKLDLEGHHALLKFALEHQSEL